MAARYLLIATALGLGAAVNGDLGAQNHRYDLPVPNPCRASFFIIGARKAGTTSFYNYLVQHPQIRPLIPYRCQPTIGDHTELCEPNALSEVHNDTLQDYLHYFPDDLKADEITGEKSVSYLTSLQAMMHIKQWCGSDVRLIAILRDPMERMFSQYLMRKRLGTLHFVGTFDGYVAKELRRFQEAELAHPTWYRDGRALFMPARNAIYEGLYAVHLQRWQHMFPTRAFSVFFYEELFSNQSAILDGLEQTFNFLGLPLLPRAQSARIVQQRYNSHSSSQPTRAAIKYSQSPIIEVKNLFNRYNRILADQLGRNLPLQWESDLP
eukprot:TRINITY_DN9877_c0_g1_i5.p1 TRINITY_DN9877_c0_g1~~TRINITY_DN9877_c0_g1_i5.p1  ORF type:complete len:323 (+),score=44.03 TRINITY_DN9877_c0_g1_i5:73-1041(+)